MYEKLFKEIDKDSNGEIEPQELEDATKNEAIKKITSKFIVKHSSEWDKKVNVPKNIKEIIEKHKEEIKNYYAIKQHLENEEKRIDNYAFFEGCSSIEGFPTSDKVFHINPIGLVGEFGIVCISLKEAKEIALKISGGYEGKDPSFSSLVGDFDAAGMSWGIIQWNFGQNTLGPLLLKMRTKSQISFDNSFSNANDLTTLIQALNGTVQQQKNWAIDMQTNHNLRWKQIFNNLANVVEFQNIQLEAVEKYDKKAISIIEWMRKQQPSLMKKIELKTFVALHDLAVQQGGLKNSKDDIILECQTNPPSTQDEFIRIVVKIRGNTASTQWRSDCVSRRLGILNGKATSVTISNITKKRTNSNYKYLKEGFICDL